MSHVWIEEAAVVNRVILSYYFKACHKLQSTNTREDPNITAACVSRPAKALCFNGIPIFNALSKANIKRVECNR